MNWNDIQHFILAKTTFDQKTELFKRLALALGYNVTPNKNKVVSRFKWRSDAPISLDKFYRNLRELNLFLELYNPRLDGSYQTEDEIEEGLKQSFMVAFSGRKFDRFNFDEYVFDFKEPLYLLLDVKEIVYLFYLLVDGHFIEKSKSHNVTLMLTVELPNEVNLKQLKQYYRSAETLLKQDQQDKILNLLK